MDALSDQSSLPWPDEFPRKRHGNEELFKSRTHPEPWQHADRTPFRASPKKLARPTTTGINPDIVQTKSEPDAVLTPKTTIATPNAISPMEIRYETNVSMFHISKRSERSNGCITSPKQTPDACNAR